MPFLPKPPDVAFEPCPVVGTGFFRPVKLGRGAHREALPSGFAGGSGGRRGDVVFAMPQKADPGLNLPFSVFVNTLATKLA
jgi:hypothetical protein